MSQGENGTVREETGAVDTLEPQLTAADRCDSCGAQAYIRVVVKSGELLFCAHHGKKYQEKLSAIAHSWHDESARLLEDQRA
ncbi:DUF7455 domain-containing protein [Mycetocola zhadangensis]|uniref:DUF7455 domain-containing protein n=1 Tax=Mycetocola zhadangensis TaxID=1164595 RepID=A0A3L7J6B2_9MICO|nr:hypothetical protein [Mycetocola zhadangensis]RLQ86060.1 hypothetical protein D9V28_04260 [Mycetocola zhadangensis]GGE88036.1 hypothetical protein GCM10011313_08360 [Mycetocola zhadangensis]